MRSSYDGSQSSVHLDIPAGIKQWFSDAWVGRLKNMKTLNEVEEDISWELGPDIVPKYLGDDMFLLLGLSDTKAEAVSTEEAQHGSTPFQTLEKWNSLKRTRQRPV